MLDQVTHLLSNASITDVHHIDSDISLILGEHKLWVTTAWRLEKDGRIVIGNDNLVELLEHEDYKFDHEDAVALIKDSLKDASIIEVLYSDFNELTLQLSNGFTFRTFQSNGQDEDDADNFQLYVAKQRYIATPDSVDLEDLHQFYKK